MNRIPLILAETVKRGNSVSTAVVLTVGVVVVAVIGGILVARLVRDKKNKSTGAVSAHSLTPEKIIPTARRHSTGEENDDAAIIRRLSTQHRDLFPADENFEMKPGWLYDEVMVSKLDGYSERCEKLLQELIKVSRGKYIAAAKIGDTFDCRKMRTNVELPDDMHITKVRLSGLIKVSTGEVMISAIVA